MSVSRSEERETHLADLFEPFVFVDEVRQILVEDIHLTDTTACAMLLDDFFTVTTRARIELLRSERAK